jgi:hypothetical protein
LSSIRESSEAIWAFISSFTCSLTGSYYLFPFFFVGVHLLLHPG